MANRTFSAQVDAWVQKSEARMGAVFRESVQRVIEVAQEPVAKGGKMPVDTGFLRSSHAVSLNGMPTGASRPPSDAELFRYEAAAASLVIARAKLGSVIHSGWTANYAIYMEEMYGFNRTAVRRWQKIVRDVVAEAKARFP